MTSVMRFDDMRVGEVMVPRREVQALHADTTIAEALQFAAEHLHTRYPVHTGDLDSADKVVHLKDLNMPGVDPDSAIAARARPLAHVPSTMRVARLLRQMQRGKQHMALVIDEFGTALGIVTLENLLEQIVGDVDDEFDEVEPVPHVDASGARVLSGSTPLRVVATMLEVPLASDRVETLNGWVVERLGRLPRVGDEVVEEEIQVQILEVTRDRATRLRVAPGEPIAADPASPAEPG